MNYDIMLTKEKRGEIMISVGDLRPGMTFQYEGNLYVVLEYSHNKTARAAANIRVKMKNMRTGSTTEITFGNNEKVARARIEKRKMQYLYDTGDMLVFMDNETYDQIEIPAENLRWEINFLKPSDDVEVTSFEGEILGVALPINVPFVVTETEPAVRGDTATSATKNATIETGFQIKVPLFISEGETVIVNTVDGKYQGRA
jgi:translation elongation factor P